MAEIEKIAVYDARIIQDPPKYAVQKGALSVSTSSFQANAANSSQLSFQVLVPSLNVFTDRKIELNSSAYVYSEAVPSQTCINAPAQTVPFQVAAGTYVAPITDAVADSYRQQDTPTAPTFKPDGSAPSGGNTALIVPANAWPGLVETSSQDPFFLAPTTFQYPLSNGLANGSTGPSWVMYSASTTPNPAVITPAQQEVTPALPNPFLVPGFSNIGGTFSVDYMLTGRINGVQGAGGMTTWFLIELIDPVVGTVFGSARADLVVQQSYGTGQGGGPIPPLTNAICFGTAPLSINSEAITQCATLAFRTTLYATGFSINDPPNGVFQLYVESNPFVGAGIAAIGSLTLRGGAVSTGSLSGSTVYRNYYQSIGASTDLSLGMFPVQSLATSVTVTINDCSVSIQGDVLREQLLLSQTRDSLMQRTCPSKFDMYAWTQDDAKTYNGVTAGFDGARDSDIPNGSYPIRFVHPTTGALLNQYDAYTVNGVVVPIINWTPAFIPLNSNLIGQSLVTSSMGTWVITPTRADIPLPIMYRYQTTEPLCVSPFLWQDSKQMTEVGLYGITNMTVNMTLGNPGAIQGYSTRASTSPLAVGQLGRLYADKLDNAYGSYQYMTRQSGINALFGNVRLQPPTQNAGNQTGPWTTPPKLLCTFLTPPPEITLPLVSSVPYVEFPRYNSTSSATWSSTGTVQVQSNTVTLSSIPDLLVVWARPAFRGQTQSDTYIPISNIGVTFDNYANLCSNYSQEDLYACAVAGGLDMDWNQFRGYARERFSTLTPVSSGALGSGVYDTFQGNSPNVQLTGSPIVLRMGQDVPLSSGLAPGTLGNYSVQVNVTLDNSNGFFNYLGGLSSSNNVIITIMGVNSGFFESVRGSSAIRKTILNTNDVEAASTSSSVTSSQLVRLVGGASGMHTSSRLTTSLGMPQFKPAMGDEPRMRKMARMSGSMIPQ
jgi:hypothetical protein